MGTPKQKIGFTMGIALPYIQSAARKGNLEIRGQIPGTTKYEVIPPDTWAHAQLMIEGLLRQDVANPFKVKITAGSPPNSELEKSLERELSYPHLDVNSHQFEKLIDSLTP